jgi:hypothetical protein
MEASLRFPGARNGDSKIFARSVGVAELDLPAAERRRSERGASTLYGKPERPVFDFRRT